MAIWLPRQLSEFGSKFHLFYIEKLLMNGVSFQVRLKLFN
jgi:hypothetical protein